VGFQHLPKSERSKAAIKGGRSQQSEALKKAWQKSEQLKKEFDSGKSPSVIAIENNINIRALYRIVRGK